MRNFKKLVLGYAPTRRFDFPDPKLAYENSLKIRRRIDQLIGRLGDIELVDLSFLNEEGLMYQGQDVPRIVKHFQAAGVDALFIPHANFGCEEAVGKLGAAMRLPTLLWGPRDEAPQGFGFRQTDTQCGLFSSSMTLMRMGARFTYIENCDLNSEVLEQGLEEFIRAASAVKAVKGARLGLLGPRMREFYSIIPDESELMNRFGIDVIPIDGTEFVAEIQRVQNEQMGKVEQLAAETDAALDCSVMKPQERVNNAAFELALRAIGEKFSLDVMAGDCFVITPRLYNALPCFAFGNLIEKGFPVICEGDVYGAISALLLTGAARGKRCSFTADMTIRHPDNDNAELLWHCGPYPKSLAKPDCHPAMDEQCMGRYEIVGGDVTVARFGGLNGKFSLFAGEGRGVDGPVTGGNYLWLEVANWPKWEQKLIYGPFAHHIAGIHGKYAGALKEACRYLDIEFVDPDE